MRSQEIFDDDSGSSGTVRGDQEFKSVVNERNSVNDGQANNGTYPLAIGLKQIRRTSQVQPQKSGT